jgi:copper chaperone NosL
MTYQPPLIGTLARFSTSRASSYPSWGTLFILTACSGPAVADAAEREQVAEFAPEMPPCDYCDGTIPEKRFGGQIVTTSGDTYRFMSAECMAGFVLENRVHAESIASMEVVDYNQGERLIDATTARYVRMQFASSPSGLDVAAVATDKIADSLHYFMGGERLTWPQVLELVRTEWGL